MTSDLRGEAPLNPTGTAGHASDPALLLQALQFSAERHRDQRRKDQNASPYINHLIEVASVLANVGGVTDISVLVAAILHDTIEDTQTSGTEIEARFGREVRLLVEEVTDDKSLAKTERKRLQVEHASRLSLGAKLIKLADKICNVVDVIHTPPTNWSMERRQEYLDWTERVVVGCRGSNLALERLYDEALRQGRAAIALLR